MLIGLDIGWSDKRRTCGVAAMGGAIRSSHVVKRGQIAAATLVKREVAQALRPAVVQAIRNGERVLMVTDAIVGASRVPSTDRHVDAECSREGFYGRAQSYPATQRTGTLLSTTLHDILDELLAETGVTWTPWLGDASPPSTGVIVIETNPTTSMAMALPMANREELPTRKTPRVLLNGTRVRAKSDWYWRSGARDIAAQILQTAAVRDEEDHERVAALWCLALASSLQESGAATLIGDKEGAYLVATLHPSWEQDAKRVGVVWGQPTFVDRALDCPKSVAEQVIDLSCLPEEERELDTAQYDDDAMRGDSVRVFFTDTGGLTRKANPWLNTITLPCHIRLFGKTTVDVCVSPFARPNDRNQFKVGPKTIPQLMREWDGPSTLHGGSDYEVRGELL